MSRRSVQAHDIEAVEQPFEKVPVQDQRPQRRGGIEDWASPSPWSIQSFSVSAGAGSGR